MFICVLREGEPLEFEFVSSEGDLVLRTAVGFDDECGTTYSALVAFVESPGMEGLDRYELTFKVVETQPDESHIVTWWDGLQSRRVIRSVADRSLVLGAILVLVKALVDVAKPKELWWITHEAGLPEQALTKYEAIGNVLRECGYEGGRADPFHGKWNWQFSLVMIGGGNPEAA